MKPCPPKLLAAIETAERLADLLEAGREDDAYQEFFSIDGRPFSGAYSAAHGAIVAALTGHAGEPLGGHLEGLLVALMRLKQPHPRGPADPTAIRSYCADIRRDFGVAAAAPPEPCQPPDAAFLGDGRFRCGGEVIHLAGNEGAVLEALVLLGAADGDSLERKSGVPSPHKVLKRLIQNHSELKPFIIFPGGKSRGGYRTTIRDEPKGPSTI